MNPYKRILLINFGGIGDEILFLPVIQSIKDTFPNSNVTLCLEGRSSSFIKLTDKIDDYFCVDLKTKNKYIEMVKLYFRALTGKYDLVISSGSNSLIAPLLFFTGIKRRVGYKTSKLSEKFLTDAIELNKNQYAAKMYFDLVKKLTKSEFSLPYINVKESEKNQNSVLIHPGVSKISILKNITKTITPDKWAIIIKQLVLNGKNVYLAGGPDDYDCIIEIRKELKNQNIENYIDLFGKTKNIQELAELIKKSEIMICSDSAPMHIGVATNTKTIAIFGPTNDETLLPKTNNFIAIKNSVCCRPCLWDKRQETCKELKCLDIDLNEIIQQVL